MVSTQSPVPVRIADSEVSNKTRTRACGEVWRKGNVEEVSLVCVLSEKWTVEERGVEVRQRWCCKGEGLLRGVHVNSESGEHLFVVVEKGRGEEVWRGGKAVEGLGKAEEAEEEDGGGRDGHFCS